MAAQVSVCKEMLLSTNSWNFCPDESRSVLVAMLGKKIDFSCSRLYKDAPGTFDGALCVWPVDEGSVGVCGFGVSCENARVVEAQAITPSTISAHSGDRRENMRENAWLDCLTGIVRETLIPWRTGIARDYPITSPAANT